MFTLTGAGREDLSAFAATPPRRPTAIRDELLVKIQAMDATDPEVTRSLIEERVTWSRAELDRYERVRGRLFGGRTEDECLGEADRIGPLTLMGGIAFEETNVRWCEHALTLLKRRTAVG